jgi:hypothetical protein
MGSVVIQVRDLIEALSRLDPVEPSRLRVGPIAEIAS